MTRFIAQIKNNSLAFSERQSEMLRKYAQDNQGRKMKIEPDDEETPASRRYLEGACVDIYCEHKYNIPRRAKNYKQKRYLFMSDFNFEVIKDKEGNPKKIPQETSKGLARDILKAFEEYCTRDMCPMPNVDLHKRWKTEWSMDYRYADYYDWLDFLGIEVDAMPTNEVFKRLYESEKKSDYPIEELGETPF